MPDERTNSMITWLNSLIQGNQMTCTIVDMIQIGQWYGQHSKTVSGKLYSTNPPALTAFPMNLGRGY
jgi:hypothetical protein